MRRGVAIGVLAGALLAVAAAGAARPLPRTSFEGRNLSEHAVNGVKPTVTFAVTANGRFVRNFVFQTLGCFGGGNFPFGTDPYAEAPWRVARIPIGRKGAFAAKRVRATSFGADGATLVATITGTFTKRRVAVGKILYTMSLSGSTCGPETIRFSVRAR